MVLVLFCRESVNAAIMRFFGSQMLHLRAFFCREYRDYALFGVEFLAEICQKFSEILRILAEILRKKWLVEPLPTPLVTVK